MNQRPSSSDVVVALTDNSPSDPVDGFERHNFFMLALHQSVLRVGWIFKTESVIVPAVLDAITSSGLVRGFLPILNRFGQSVPPLFYAQPLSAMRRKKWSLVSTTGLMGAPLIVLGFMLLTGVGLGSNWMPWLFLALYTFFCCLVGLNTLAFGTLQAKLIRPVRWGRLLSVSSFLGAVGAVGFSLWLMWPWMSQADGGFGECFIFGGASFLVAAACAALVREQASSPRPAAADGQPSRRGGAIELIRRDANFRRLALVSMLFATSFMLFPHYQALARERLDLTGVQLMLWVVVQNTAIGLVSLLIGPLADRRGSRAALGVALLFTAVTPALAVLLTHVGLETGRDWFWTVFIPLAFTPVSLKTLQNYTLEIAPDDEHARYLAAMNLSLAIPFLLSPLLGWLIEAVDFDLVFYGCAAALLCGAALTRRLVEPRRHVASEPVVVPLEE